MALVLTRRNGEEITLYLDPNHTREDLEDLMTKGVAVKVASVDGGRVKLAVDAPDSVDIYRSELLESDPV